MKYWQSIIVISTLSLGACSSNTVKDTLGLGRAAPDEFRVVSRPPLSVPPQFTLRPPSATSGSFNQMAADKRAESLVTGSGMADTSVMAVTASDAKTLKKGDKKSKPVSGAESQLLKNAGADMADPNVRETLAEEKYIALEKAQSDSWWDILSFGSEDKDPLVDAKKEAQRIEKNEIEGQPVTEGETPEIKAKDRGVLGRLLGD